MCAGERAADARALVTIGNARSFKSGGQTEFRRFRHSPILAQPSGYGGVTCRFTVTCKLDSKQAFVE
jgi:hypothetical protein